MKNKCIVFTAPGKTEVMTGDLDDKNIESMEILVRNHYSLISAGTELACLSGKEGWFKLPRTPGYIAVGEILKTGSAVENFKSGEIVYTYGPHSQFFKYRLDWHLCLKVPEGIPEQLLVFTRMASIAFTAIRTSKVELGDWVGVTGAGLVGNLAAQLAQLQGGRVVIIDLSAKRLQFAQQCGIEFYLSAEKETLRERLVKMTGQAGVSTLIEATGVPAVVMESLQLVSKHGELILLGSPRGEFQANVTELLNYIHLEIPHGSIEIKGAHEWRYPLRREEFVKHSMERNAQILFNLIKEKKLKIEPLLTHLLRPQEATLAYAGLTNKKDEYIGVVFDWTGEPG